MKLTNTDIVLDFLNLRVGSAYTIRQISQGTGLSPLQVTAVLYNTRRDLKIQRIACSGSRVVQWKLRQKEAV